MYGDCPGWRSWKGVEGQLSIGTTEPAAQPDILINAGGGAATLLCEVKPAANQFEPYPHHTVPRELENQDQVLRYILALSIDTTGRFPNPQLGPNIVPASRQNADGSTTWIFSGPDWSRFSKAPPTIRSNGIIYYITQRPPEGRPPVPLLPHGSGNQNQNQKQDPRDTPTQRPTTTGRAPLTRAATSARRYSSERRSWSSRSWSSLSYPRRSWRCGGRCCDRYRGAGELGLLLVTGERASP